MEILEKHSPEAVKFVKDSYKNLMDSYPTENQKWFFEFSFGLVICTATVEGVKLIAVPLPKTKIIKAESQAVANRLKLKDLDIEKIDQHGEFFKNQLDPLIKDENFQRINLYREEFLSSKGVGGDVTKTTTLKAVTEAEQAEVNDMLKHLSKVTEENRTKIDNPPVKWANWDEIPKKIMVSGTECVMMDGQPLQ